MSFDLLETEDQRRERVSKAIAFAGKYALSFDRELLNHWYRQVVEHTLQPSATHAEHAYHEGQRAFVIGIIRQYQLATTGSYDTQWQPMQPTPPKKPQQRRRLQQQPRKQQRRQTAKSRRQPRATPKSPSGS